MRVAAAIGWRKPQCVREGDPAVPAVKPAQTTGQRRLLEGVEAGDSEHFLECRAGLIKTEKRTPVGERSASRLAVPTAGCGSGLCVSGVVAPAVHHGVEICSAVDPAQFGKAGQHPGDRLTGVDGARALRADYQAAFGVILSDPKPVG